MVDRKLSRRVRYIKMGAGWTAFILFVVTQWEVTPWSLFSLSFFGLFWISQSLNLYEKPRLWKVVVIAGGTLNGLVLVANNGRMPVLGRTEISRWWQPLTDDSRLVFLCDIHMKCSIGDIVVLVGVTVIPLICWLVQRNQNLIKIPQVNPQRAT